MIDEAMVLIQEKLYLFSFFSSPPFFFYGDGDDLSWFHFGDLVLE